MFPSIPVKGSYINMNLSLWGSSIWRSSRGVKMAIAAVPLPDPLGDKKCNCCLKRISIRCWTFTHSDTFPETTHTRWYIPRNYGEEEIKFQVSGLVFRDWQYLGTVDSEDEQGDLPTVTRYKKFPFACLREFHSLLQFSLQPSGFGVQLHLKLFLFCETWRLLCSWCLCSSATPEN